MESECLYRFVYGATDIFAPHCHDYYEIFITLSGTVTHWINGKTCNLPEGSLVFIRPDDVHGYTYDVPKSTETSYVNFTFNRETAEQLFQYLSESFPSKELLSCDMPPTVIVSSTEKKRLLAQLSELNAVNWQDKHLLKVKARVFLADVFTRYFHHAKIDSRDNIPLWLQLLLRNMEQPEHFVAGTERMIALSEKSREHLSRSLKKYLGLTPSEYVNDLRINYASNLLLNTNTSVIDICYSCGFQNLSHFYRIFKEKYNLSPGDFRKQYK